MSYTVHQAKTNFSRLLKEAEAGKEVIVTRGKKPVAKIVPIEPPARQKRLGGQFHGLIQAEDTVFDPLTDEQLVDYGFGFMNDGSNLPELNKSDRSAGVK
jgi:prevent-host-death family protein